MNSSARVRFRQRRALLALVLALVPGTLSGCASTYRSHRIVPDEITAPEAVVRIGGVVTRDGRNLPLDQPPEADWAVLRADTLIGSSGGEPLVLPLAVVDSLWIFQPVVKHRIDIERWKRLLPGPPERKTPVQPKLRKDNLRRIVKFALLVVVLNGPQIFKKHVIR